MVWTPRAAGGAQCVVSTCCSFQRPFTVPPPPLQLSVSPPVAGLIRGQERVPVSGQWHLLGQGALCGELPRAQGLGGTP